MTAKEIKVLMILLGVTQTSIAKKVRVTLPAVHAVINGLRKNPKIRRAIADAIGRPVEHIWPPDLNTHINDTNINHITNHTRRQAGKRR